MDELRDIFEIRLRQTVDSRLVSRAVDDYGRMATGKGDDCGIFRLGHEVGALDVNEHAKFVSRLQIFLGRNPCMEPDKIEAEFLALQSDHAVVVKVTRNMDGLREVAMLRHTAKIDWQSVQAKLLAIRREAAYAELLGILAFGRLDTKRVTDGSFRRPEVEPFRRQGKVAYRLSSG